MDPGVGNPSLAHTVDEGQAFTGAACRENEVEVEKELAVAFFVAAIAVSTQLFHVGHLQLPDLVVVMIFQLHLFGAPTHLSPGAFVL